jgi:hypothetical protein
MTVGYMSGGKRARNIPSITNNICNLGGNKKGGLISMQGKNPNLRSVIRMQASYCRCGMPLGCIQGLQYLKANNLLSKNPVGSGGVPSKSSRPNLH